MPSRMLNRFPQLRRLTATPAVQRPLAIGRQQRLVAARASFIINGLRGGTRSYRLASDRSRHVVIRHATRDMEIFDEIFRPPAAYEPPLPAVVRLMGIVASCPLRVLDLGGNIGLFGVDVLCRYRGAEVTSYEPDPDNIPALTRCVSLNGAGTTWKVFHACAMPSDGPVHLAAGNFADSFVCDSGKEVDGVDILPVLGKFDFVKMDIEGSEWPILSDPRWPEAVRGVDVFVMEWHQRGCPSSDHRSAAIRAVESAGFTVEVSDPGWDHGMIWGWRNEVDAPGGDTEPHPSWVP